MGNNKQSFLYALYIWAVISDSTNGLESKLLNKYKKIDLNTNIESQCICLEHSRDQKTIPDLLDPRKEGLERLLIFLYKDNTGTIQLYIPGPDRQATIPDLQIEDTDLSVVVTSEVTFESLFHHRDRVLNIHPFKFRPVIKPNSENDGTIPYTEIPDTPAETFEEAPPSWPDFDNEYLSSPELYNNEVKPNENIPYPHPQTNEFTPNSEPHDDSYIVPGNIENSTPFFNYKPSNFNDKENSIPTFPTSTVYDVPDVKKTNIVIKPKNKNNFVLPVYNRNTNILPFNYGSYYDPKYNYNLKSTDPMEKNQFSTFDSKPKPYTKANNNEEASYNQFYHPDLKVTPSRPIDGNEENIPNYQLPEPITPLPGDTHDDSFVGYPSEVPPYSSDNFHDALPYDQDPVMAPPPPEEISQISDDKDPTSIKSNPIISDLTFNQWFATQLKNMESRTTFTPIDIHTLEILIKKSLMEHGLYVSSKGKLIDSNGRLLNMSNLHIRPLLIGETVEYDKLLAKHTNYVLPRNLPYLESLLITLLYPPKIIGIIPMGKFYLPTSLGQVGVFPHSNLHSVTTNSKVSDLSFAESIKYMMPKNQTNIQISVSNRKSKGNLTRPQRFKDNKFIKGYSDHRSQDIPEIKNRKYEKDLVLERDSTKVSQSVSEITEHESTDFSAPDQNNSQVDLVNLDDTTTPQVAYPVTEPLEVSTDQTNKDSEEEKEVILDNNYIVPINSPTKENKLLEKDLEENASPSSPFMKSTKNKNIFKKQKGKTKLQFNNIKNYRTVVLKLLKLLKRKKPEPPIKEGDEDLKSFDPEFRIIGGAAATGSGSPISSRGRSGLQHFI